MNAKPRPQTAQRQGVAETARARAVAPVLLDLLRPYRLLLVVLLLLMLGQSVLTLINPWLAGRFAAAVLHNSALWPLMLGWFALLLVQGVLAYLIAVRTRVVGSNLSADASMRIFDRLQALPMAWHQERRRGDVLNLLLRDVDFLADFTISTLVPLLPLLLTCAGALVMMLRIEPWFASAAAVLVPAVYVAMRWSGRRLRPLGRAATDAYVARSVAAEQSLALLPVVKAFTGELLESGRFGERARGLRDLDIRLARANAVITPAVRVFSAAVVLGLLWLASRELAAGKLGADDLISLLLYGLLLTQPVSALAGVYGRAHSAHAVAQRLTDIFGAHPERDCGEQAPAQARGDIEFDQVEFSYPGRAPLLQGLDLHLQPGEVVAITGVNGAGKTTLMHLLLRFVEPTSGRILLDGRDVREYTLRALRGHVGLVPQKVLLFNGSIGENIAYGKHGASQAQIEQAARLAQAHDFIADFADGYDTRVGDDGVRLSGGQRQRIALARALLKDPAVLVFDEATAMFDPEAERAFVHAYRHHLHQRSLLLITHRPAGLALADRVLRLEDGHLHAVTAHSASLAHEARSP